jgi:transposase-like protein
VKIIVGQAILQVMCYEEITCPSCSSRKIKKNGLTANAKQRYRSTDCGRQFITDYTYLGRLEAIRRLVIPLTINGCGTRDTARVLLISPTTVLKILRAAAAQVPEPDPPRHIRDLEITTWVITYNKQGAKTGESSRAGKDCTDAIKHLPNPTLTVEQTMPTDAYYARAWLRRSLFPGLISFGLAALRGIREGRV